MYQQNKTKNNIPTNKYILSAYSAQLKTGLLGHSFSTKLLWGTLHIGYDTASSWGKFVQRNGNLSVKVKQIRAL